MTFIKLPFPGWSMFELAADSAKPIMGELTEYLVGDFLNDSKLNCLELYVRQSCYRHFAVQFLSANIAFHVLAEDFEIMEEAII